MNRVVKLIACVVLCCMVIYLLVVLLTWNHLQTQIDGVKYGENIAKKLCIARSELVMVNKPKLAYPTIIFKYLGDRQTLLSKCDSLSNQELGKLYLSEGELDEIKDVFQKEYNRQKERVLKAFCRYEIDFREEITNLYYIKESPLFGNFEFRCEVTIVETLKEIYFICYIR